MYRRRYNVLRLILGIGVFVYIFYNSPTISYLNCQNSKCTVIAKSTIGKTISKKELDLSTIKDFDLKQNYRYSRSRRNYYNNNVRYRYYIYAITNDGKSFRFFDNYTTSSQTAHNKVQELRQIIKNQPVNISTKF